MEARAVRTTNGFLFLLPHDGVVLVVAQKHDVGLAVAVDPVDLLEELARIIETNPTLFFEERYGEEEEEVEVPPFRAITAMLHALRALLANTPRPVKEVNENEEAYYVWSPYEEEAARKAAILLDIVAMLLSNPEQMLKHLPEDVDLLIKRHRDLKSYLEGGSSGGD